MPRMREIIGRAIAVLLGNIGVALAITNLGPAAWAQSLTPFTSEAESRGLYYSMQDYPQAYGHLGFAAGFADLDSDGDPDIVPGPDFPDF